MTGPTVGTSLRVGCGWSRRQHRAIASFGKVSWPGSAAANCPVTLSRVASAAFEGLVCPPQGGGSSGLRAQRRRILPGSTTENDGNIRSWSHSGFSLDQSVRVEAQESEGIQRLMEYFLRCPFSQARKRWAALIKQVYEADPLLCPKCGGEMKIISFIERHQSEVMEKILRHCGLWQEAAACGPPVQEMELA